MVAPARTVREQLLRPLALTIGTIWVGSAVYSALENSAVMFMVASGPFTILCGYVFADRIVILRNGKNGH